MHAHIHLQIVPSLLLHLFTLLRDLLRDRANDWQQFFDWYHKDFIDSHILYNSWDDLKSIITGEGCREPGSNPGRSDCVHTVHTAPRHELQYTLYGTRTVASSTSRTCSHGLYHWSHYVFCDLDMFAPLPLPTSG